MLKIVPRKIDDLTPYSRNARTHSDAQVAQIMASIVEYGWTNSILTDGNNGILAGHGRLAAARRLRDAGTAIPRWPDPDVVPTVDLAHLTPAQKRAYVLQDNKSALNAGWDFDMLAVELADLRDEGFDLDLTGFGEDEVGAILDSSGTPDLDDLEEQYGEDDERAHWPRIALQVPREVLDRYESVMRSIPAGQDWERFDRLLSCVDLSALAEAEADVGEPVPADG
jgi:ParB-like chromosome segregation protein Spo0J